MPYSMQILEDAAIFETIVLHSEDFYYVIFGSRIAIAAFRKVFPNDFLGSLEHFETGLLVVHHPLVMIIKDINQVSRSASILAKCKLFRYHLVIDVRCFVLPRLLASALNG